MDKILKIYKSLSQTQILSSAKFLQDGVIHTIWTQRNIETGKNIKYLRTHIAHNDFHKIVNTLPVDVSHESLVAISFSEKNRAVLREIPNSKDNRKQLLEIWTNNHLSHSVDLTALNIHGDVYTDVEFKSFAWSPDETKLMYIAEKKPPAREPFYKRKGPEKNDGGDTNSATPATKGEEYVFRQDWGEQLVGKYASVIAIYDLQHDTVNILEGIPENVCPGQVTWSRDGTYIVGVGLEMEPRKLGLIYCVNRVGAVFRLDFNGNYVRLSEERKTVMCPKFSPDGKYLIWLEKESNGPHHGAVRLMRLDLFGDSETTKPCIVVDIVQTQIKTCNDESFFGLFNTSLPDRCWASDNRRILLSTPQECSVKSYVIHIESGAIFELKFDVGSQIILDVFQDRLLLSRKNYLQADQCITAVLPAAGQENTLEWKAVTEYQPIELLDHFKYEYLDFQHDNDDAIKRFTGIYLGPKSGTEKQVPLIIWPHGGPHATFFNTFALEPSVLISLGFAIMFVNYRGSTGTGQASVDFLLGRVGDSDVKDCMLAAQESCKRFPWLNPKRMALVGGSHGGFLIHHLSGQYPSTFQAVVSRNPVVDIASMNIVSDIPDWCAVEAGGSYTQQGAVDNKLLLKMREASPIQHAHKITAATYLMLGTKDLRVPYSQGLELYHRLKANNVPVKANIYKDNHALSSVPNEMDHIINSALWLLKYTS